MFGNRKPKENHLIAALKSMHGIRVEDISVDRDGNVRAVLSCPPLTPEQAEIKMIEAEQILRAVNGVRDAKIIMTSEKLPEDTAPKKSKTANTEKIHIDAKQVIAVASGKGGVGKSTVAMNLAAGMARQGLRIGLLDADIYGPSVPRMTGLVGQKPTQTATGKIAPLRAHEMDIMSIGFMIDEESPLIWRGPMVQSAFTQLLQDVAWDGLDALIIDLPPGTGDVQLTMAQRVPLTGAVIVSTPQDIALTDVRKGIEMFKKVNVPIIGLVENMSIYCCPNCGHTDDIFGHGGAKAEAEKLGIPYLGGIPLNKDIRQKADLGLPALPEYYDAIIAAMRG